MHKTKLLYKKIRLYLIKQKKAMLRAIEINQSQVIKQMLMKWLPQDFVDFALNYNKET